MRIRSLIVASILAITGFVVPLSVAVPASADTGYFDMAETSQTCDNFCGYWLATTGHNQPVVFSVGDLSEFAETTFSGDSPGWYHLTTPTINGTECVNVPPSTGQLYIDSCVGGDSYEEFQKQGYFFENLHLGAFLGEAPVTSPYYGQPLFSNVATQWQTPAA